MEVPRPHKVPDLQIRIPVIQDKESFVKRMAAFALIMLTLYYAVISYAEARDNHKLLNSQSHSLARVTDDLHRALDDLDQARAERAALIRIAIAQNERIKKLGGDSIDPFTVGLPTRPSPHPTPGVSPTPRTSFQPVAKPTPKPNQKPTPKASSDPSPKPNPKPTPKPSPSPLLCVDTPLGRVCTPA